MCYEYLPYIFYQLLMLFCLHFFCGKWYNFRLFINSVRKRGSNFFYKLNDDRVFTGEAQSDNRPNAPP
jgi:hypothetical protein